MLKSKTSLTSKSSKSSKPSKPSINMAIPTIDEITDVCPNRFIAVIASARYARNALKKSKKIIDKRELAMKSDQFLSLSLNKLVNKEIKIINIPKH